MLTTFRVFSRRFLPALMAGLPLAAATGSEQPQEPLSAYVQRRLGELDLVGAGIGVIRSDGATWTGGFGFANVEEKIPATAESVALWASCSKVVTGATAMSAMETKGISLDAPIQPLLPFVVSNPNFPNTPITFRMLLTHTSSILYDIETGHSLYGAGDPAMGLEEFLREYLTPLGRFYKPSNYSASAPGQVYVYSNINASLLGFLVERITGMPFTQYCRRALLAPLGIDEAGWSVADLDGSRLVAHYRAPRPDGKPRRVRHYGWPGYPDGMFRCSAAGMLRILSMLLGEGAGGSAGVLSPEALAEMFKPHGVDPVQLRGPSPLVTVDTGLVWRLLDLDGRRVWSHTGNGSGLGSVILLDRDSKAAAVAWVSGGVLETREGQAFFLELIHRLFAEMGAGRR